MSTAVYPKYDSQISSHAMADIFVFFKSFSGAFEDWYPLYPRHILELLACWRMSIQEQDLYQNYNNYYYKYGKVRQKANDKIIDSIDIQTLIMFVSWTMN